MRIFLYPFILLLIPFVSFSGNISPEQASKVARNFYFERINLVKPVSIEETGIAEIRSIGSPAIYYVFNMKPDGYVVVSASDNVIPVLAYSFEGSYSEESKLHDGYKVWMNHYKNQVEYAIAANIIPSSQTVNEWQRLLSDNFVPQKSSGQVLNVNPLLVSKWDQDVPFNNQCPLDPAGPGGHCLTGCVATAMGQLLYYYRFPLTGQGSYTYTHPDYGTISADFGATTYHWDGMPSQPFLFSNPLSELLFHQGVSVDMDYGPDASGMWNHKAAYSLKTYFRYGPETRYFFRDSVSIDWDSLLVTNLNQRKPLYYAGWAGVQSTSGHAFVCDGYQPGNYYHFNWGWGGSQDGYFYTNNLTPGGNNFNFAQEVIPMFPDTVQNTYPTSCQGVTTFNSLRGSVEDGSGWYNYQNNLACSWLIAPDDTEYDSVKSVKITFLKFDTEAGSDSLYIYNGPDASAPLLGAYTGSSVPGTITSATNKVFIKFKTNGSGTREGWQLDFESVFPVYCSGTTTLTATNGSISDGSGSYNYCSNSNCRWKITPSGGLPVTFVFSSFTTFDSTDIVKFYDLQTQEVLATFSGNQLPPPVTAMSGKMYIVFLTNTTGNAQGWSGNYYSSGVGLDITDSVPGLLSVYPNPVVSNLTVEKYSSGCNENTIQIIDMKGSILITKRVNVTEGINIIQVDMGKLASSVYVLSIEDCKHLVIRKLVFKK